MKNQNPVAYIAPLSIPEWEIQKDDHLIFNENRKSYSKPNSNHDLPSEIVETWEPIFPEVNPDNNVKDKITSFLEQEKLFFAGRINQAIEDKEYAIASELQTKLQYAEHIIIFIEELK